MLQIEFTRFVPDEYKDVIREKISEVLEYFPELKPDVIRVGWTESEHYIGRYMANKSDSKRIYIQLSKHASVAVISHEFVHHIQFKKCTIPLGERPCELWNIARSPDLQTMCQSNIFEYPAGVSDNWEEWKYIAHEVAKDAIKKREDGLRNYLKWYEDKMFDIFNATEKEKERYDKKDLWNVII